MTVFPALLTTTVKSQIIEQCATSLELPPLVRSGVFLFFCLTDGLSSSFFAAIPPFPR